MQLHMMFGSDDGEGYKVFGVCVTRIVALPNFKQCEVILLKGEKSKSSSSTSEMPQPEECAQIAP